MTRPRATVSPGDELGAILASLKARIQAVELLAHTPCSGGGGGTGIGLIVCLSTTRPGAPAVGQLIYETDTDSILIWSGSAWVYVADEQLLSLNPATGRVGVNTTSPSYSLDVTGDIRATGTIYADGTVVFEGTADANEITLGVINPTADRAINLPNASGNLALTSATDGTITLGTDTAGNYVAGATAGTGITVTGTPGEGWSPTVAVDSTVAIKGSIALGTDTTGNYVSGITAGSGISVSGTPAPGWSPTITATGGTSDLVLVKTQAIGSGVNTITVTSAFSATYDAYRIIVYGGSASAGGSMRFNLDGITTGYYSGRVTVTYSTAAVAGAADNNTGYWTCGALNSGGTSRNQFVIDVFSPFLSTETWAFGSFVSFLTGGAASASWSGMTTSTSSATGFRLQTSTGTVTGGDIYVYGYRI